MNKKEEAKLKNEIDELVDGSEGSEGFGGKYALLKDNILALVKKKVEETSSKKHKSKKS